MTITEMLERGAGVRALATALHRRLTDIRAEALAEAAVAMERWEPSVSRPEFLIPAANLALYLALRKRDLTAEQEALSALGLSSLGRAEAHVLETLDAVILALAALAGEAPDEVAAGRSVRRRPRRVDVKRDALFGADPSGPETRVLVTLPTAAADDPALVAELVSAGATAVRINCAHDDPAAWSRMIAHTRTAADAVGRRVPVLMDLAGPKVRTMRVTVPPAFLDREKPKKLKKLRAEGVDPVSRGPRLQRGDTLVLTDRISGESGIVEATLSHPELLDRVAPGTRVWFDDGKLGAQVLECEARRALLQVTEAKPGGQRLAAEKGVNMPGIEVDIPALTDADLSALDFVASHADLVGFSFVQTSGDVRALHAAIAERLPEGRKPPAIVLKIETELSVRNLPGLIVAAGGAGEVAVMIARGDLAVEIGLARLSEIQEEILWICEAAEVPVVWATQVLETLAKEGRATRAEATDAAMGQRAECVMLNKGPYAAEAVAFLVRVLRRMDRHQSKKSPRLAPLRSWHDLQSL